MAKCSAIKPNGTRCKGIAIDGSDYCYAHHPEHAETRRRNASKGGRRGGRGRPVSELAALRDENAEIRRMLLEGEVKPGVASVVIQSLNLAVRAVDITMKAKEQEELIERLEELEAALEHRKGSRYGY
jgi:hypothetical protein